jgi:hypothetical protein
MRFADLLLILRGSSSGEQILKAAAAASGAITLPAGTTDFSGTGGANQVVKQTTAGGAFTVGAVGATELIGQVPVANGGTGAATFPVSSGSTGSLTASVLLGAGTAAVTTSPYWGTYGDTAFAGYANGAAAPRIEMGHALGTAGAPTALTNGDSLGEFTFFGRAATGWSAAPRVRIAATATETWSNTANGTSVTFRTTPNGGNSTAVNMTLDGSGNLTTVGQVNSGDPTTNTYAQLSAAGAATIKSSSTNATVLNINNTSAVKNWVVQVEGTANTSGQLDFYDGAACICTINPTPNSGSGVFGFGGGVVIGSPTGGNKGAGTINATIVHAQGAVLTSDARLKRDIEPLPDCLGLVATIAPRQFRWEEIEPEKKLASMLEQFPPGFFERRNWGFLAQDVKAAMSAAGHEFGGVIEDAEGNQSLSPSDLTAVLWKAVQELTARVAALEGRPAG